MKETIYAMTCGCKLKADERVRVKNKAYQYPNHPEGRIDHMLKKCVDCCKIIEVKGTATVRCPACQKKQNKKNDKRAKLKYRYGITIESEEEKYKAACNSLDCKHRDECIVEHYTRKYLPCLDCQKYEKISSAELMKFNQRIYEDHGILHISL